MGEGTNPYAGARALLFNLRMLDPLNDRYKPLVRDLGDEGARCGPGSPCCSSRSTVSR